MSSLNGKSEEDMLNFLANIFATITNSRDVKVSHLVMCPEDWILAREIPKIFSPEANKNRFEKGCCAWLWGAYVWVESTAGDMKAYGEDEFSALEINFPELAKNIKALEDSGYIV